DAADYELAILHTTDHVHVDHGDCVRKRRDRMIDVVIRSQQSFYFTTESNENQRAFQLRSLGAKDARQFDQSGRAGSVVVSAVMYLAGLRRETILATTTEVIIMRADDDRFVFKNRIGSFKHADYVVRGNFGTHDVGCE